MVTRVSPSSSPSPSPERVKDEEDPGFVGLLVKSIWEPGANAAVVMAMNICFLLLIITLFGLAALTGFNLHVLLLLGVTCVLWGAMMWFVMELTKVTSRPDNMPPPDPLSDTIAGQSGSTASADSKKER